MIGSLTGNVIARLPGKVLLEVGGVGYWVFVGAWEPKAAVTTFLHHHIREDAEDLYGFEDLNTLQLFEKLIDVNGVGPKAALQILTLGEPARIIQAILSGDTTFLSLASGVGKKAAEKICLELKNRLGDLETTSSSDRNLNPELISALEGLGYKRGQIVLALTELPPNLTTIEDQLKAALKLL